MVIHYAHSLLNSCISKTHFLPCNSVRSSTNDQVESPLNRHCLSWKFRDCWANIDVYIMRGVGAITGSQEVFQLMKEISKNLGHTQ